MFLASPVAMVPNDCIIGSSENDWKYCWMKCFEVSDGFLLFTDSLASIRPEKKDLRQVREI